MSIFGRFGKSKELYVLKRMDEEGEEIIGKYKEFINKKEVSVDIESGVLDEGIYRLFQVVNGSETRKWTLKPRQPKKIPEDISGMEKDEAFKAVQNKAEELRGQVSDFKKFRDGVLTQFGEGSDNSGSGDIEIPADLKGLGDGMNRGFGRAAYTGLAKRDVEFVDNLFGFMGGLSDLATGVGYALAARAGVDGLKKLDAKRKRRELAAEEKKREGVGEEVKKEERKAEMEIVETEKEKVMKFGAGNGKKEEEVKAGAGDFKPSKEDFETDVLDEEES